MLLFHKQDAYATLPFIQTAALRAFVNNGIFITEKFMKAYFANNHFFF